MHAIRSRDPQRIREALEVHTIDSARGLAFILAQSTD
jgi:hypothetical protein